MDVSGEVALSREMSSLGTGLQALVATRRSLCFASHLGILGFEVQHHVDL